MAKQEQDPAGNTEALAHIPGKIVIGATKSPEGIRCIGMIYNNEEWLLFTAMSSTIASAVRTRLKEQFNVDSVLGIAINHEQSLEKNEVVLMDNGIASLNGVYVKSEDFDALRKQGTWI